jgi:hypothetical protein
LSSRLRIIDVPLFKLKMRRKITRREERQLLNLTLATLPSFTQLSRTNSRVCCDGNQKINEVKRLIHLGRVAVKWHSPLLIFSGPSRKGVPEHYHSANSPRHASCIFISLLCLPAAANFTIRERIRCLN